MNEHQKIAEFLYGFLCSDHVMVPGSRGNDVQNAKGWLAAIVQGQIQIAEPQPINEVEDAVRKEGKEE